MNPFPFSSYIIPAIFALAALTTVAGAIIAVMTTRIIRSVSGLMLCCIGLAGLYYFLNSPFLALMEILIYVGAVCITIIFGVMLSEPDEPRDASRFTGILWGGLAAFVSTLVFVSLARLSLQHPWPAAPVMPLNDGSVAAIGRALLTTYSLPFELISLVLLLAILGALVIARGGRHPGANVSQDALGIVASEIKAPAEGRASSVDLMTIATAAAPTETTHR